MSIAQRVFLHKQAHDIVTILNYFNQRRAEDEHLDFKREAWKSNEGTEAMKDIASFANDVGGDIIIGIDEEDDHASEWTPALTKDVPGIIERLRNWLTDLIQPREFAGLVDIVATKTADPAYSIITVSIPPSPYLVGVEKKSYLGFPIRVGRKTRWLIFDEIMSRATITARATFIKLNNLIGQWGGSGAAVLFSSPIYVNTEGVQFPLPVPHGMHAQYQGLTADTITVRLQNVALMKRIEDYATMPFGYELTIPLEFVRTAWFDPNKRNLEPRLSIALDADIVWDGAAWKLITSAFR